MASPGVVQPPAVPSVAVPAAPVATAGVMSQAKQTLNNAVATVTGSPGLMVALVFIILIIVFVSIYIYVQVKGGLNYYTALSKPMYLNNLTAQTLASDASFPVQNVQEFTYGFWVFYNGLSKSNNYKLVLRRGDNPIIYFDRQSNVMHVRLRTGQADLDGTIFNTLDANTTVANSNSNSNGPTSGVGSATVTSVDSGVAFENDLCHYIDMKVDYVPMQRWVFYTLTIDHDFVSLYQDGDIYKVMNLSGKTVSSNGTGCPTSVNGISKTAGDMAVGGSATAPAPDAVISRVVFFNYAITMQDVQTLYNKGPMPQSILSALGLPVYGVRNPFYRIDNIDSTSSS